MTEVKTLEDVKNHFIKNTAEVSQRFACMLIYTLVKCNSIMTFKRIVFVNQKLWKSLFLPTIYKKKYNSVIFFNSYINFVNSYRLFEFLGF